MASQRKRVPHSQDRTYGARYQRANQKEVFWRHHLDCWSQTTLTQVAYCENNGLSPTSFARWKALLTPRQPKRVKRTAKILVDRPYYEAKRQCTYCGGAYKDILFLGPDETVSICSDCVFQKYKEFLTKHTDNCILCKMEDPRSFQRGEAYVLRDHLRLCEQCIRSVITLVRDKFGPPLQCSFCGLPPTDKATQSFCLRSPSGLTRVCARCIDLLYIQKLHEMKRICFLCQNGKADGIRYVQHPNTPGMVCEPCLDALQSSRSALNAEP